MNGYSYQRLKDEEIPSSLIIAVGLDHDTPGLVMIDLIIPHYHGAYRFTVPQFDMFTYAIVGAAKLSQKMEMTLQCLSYCLDGEDPAMTQRMMQRMSNFFAEVANAEGGQDYDLETHEAPHPANFESAETVQWDDADDLEL